MVEPSYSSQITKSKIDEAIKKAFGAETNS